MIAFRNESYIEEVTLEVEIGDLIDILVDHGFEVKNVDDVSIGMKVEIEGKTEVYPPDLQLTVPDLIDGLEDYGYSVMDDDNIHRLAEVIVDGDIDRIIAELRGEFDLLASAVATRKKLREKFNV